MSLPPSLSLSILVFLVLLILCACAETEKTERVTRIVETVQSKETLAIRNKLATAEGRVSDLISRLDSVSDDASRAKNEIHTTLMEVWKVVDLLGRDRCGEVVDKVRLAQKKAENKVNEQQDEITTHLKTIEELKLQIAKSGDSVSSLRTEINAERSRREALETEARELRDKLHWASAVSNETQMYDIVSERLQNLLVVVTERTQMLNRILTMVSDSHSGFVEWRSEIDSLTKLVRDAERDFSGGYQSAAMEGLRRHISELERQLKDAQRGRETLSDERNTMRRSIEALQNKISSAGTAITGGRGDMKERIVVRADRGTSILGVITMCLVSLCTGACAVFFMVGGNSNTTGGTEKYGFTPTSARTSPGFQNSASSPLSYVNNPGSATRTPGSLGSTPRRY